jgi:hypothetical protein
MRASLSSGTADLGAIAYRAASPCLQSPSSALADRDAWPRFGDHVDGPALIAALGIAALSGVSVRYRSA